MSDDQSIRSVWRCRRILPARQLVGIVLALLCSSAAARDPGPESGPEIDSIERARAEGPQLAQRCHDLTEEVKRLHALRTEVEALKSGGEFYMRRITLPGSSALMFDRIQELKREIRRRENANPREPALRSLKEEHNRLHDLYVAEMNAQLASHDDQALADLGVRSYDALVARYARAREEWGRVEARYPEASKEQADLCRRSRQAEALIAAGSCDQFNTGARTAAHPQHTSGAAHRQSDRLAALLGIGTANAIGTAPGEIAAYARGVYGVACVQRRATRDWARLALGGFVNVGDTVRTGADGRIRLEFTDRDEVANAGPSVMNLAPGTELVIERFSINLRDSEREQRRREGVLSLIRGEIRAFMKGWGSSSSVNVRAGVTLCGIRGTDFALRHEPDSGQVELKVAEGKVELSTPAGKALVGAGQMAGARGRMIGRVSPMPPEVWDLARAATDTPRTQDPNDRAGADSQRSGSAPVTPPLEAVPDWGCASRFQSCQIVLFDGRHYQTVYWPGTNAEGAPVAEYFYPPGSDGRPVFQDGTELWNSFVRVPDGYPSTGSWQIEWLRQGERWTKQWRLVREFVPLSDAPHVQATEAPHTVSPPATSPANR